MAIDLSKRVAVVTGAGNGLGRSYALHLARYGAKVIVNDLGGDKNGSAISGAAAERVVQEIRELGGTAIANGGDVTNPEQMAELVAEAEANWGSVDILINNAGILRDRSFAKMELADFRKLVEVHLMGAVNATKAVWPGMRERRYGRIVMTTSSSGLYGNFGQSNYGAAKMALVGLTRTLSIEGAKDGIRVNCIAPTAATRMTDDVLTADMLDRLNPDAVAPVVVALCAEAAPNGTVLCAGAGSVEQAHITLTRGVRFADGSMTAEAVLQSMERIGDRTGEMVPTTGWDQARWELNADREPARVEAAS